MKRTLLLLIILVLVGIPSHADVKARASDDAIATIRSQYASINKKLRRYKKVKKDASGYSAEGGTMDAYFDGKAIMKIAARFYGEMGRTDEEYYYWDGQLIFIFRKESTYDLPLSGKVVSTKENRFYFNNGKMIRWVDENGRQVSSSDTSYSEKQKECLESSLELSGVARSK